MAAVELFVVDHIKQHLTDFLLKQYVPIPRNILIKGGENDLML